MATKAKNSTLKTRNSRPSGVNASQKPRRSTSGTVELRREHERDEDGDRVEDVADHALREAGEDAHGQHGDDRQVDPGQL